MGAKFEINTPESKEDVDVQSYTNDNSNSLDDIQKQEFLLKVRDFQKKIGLIESLLSTTGTIVKQLTDECVSTMPLTDATTKLAERYINIEEYQKFMGKLTTINNCVNDIMDIAANGSIVKKPVVLNIKEKIIPKIATIELD